MSSLLKDTSSDNAETKESSPSKSHQLPKGGKEEDLANYFQKMVVGGTKHKNSFLNQTKTPSSTSSSKSDKNSKKRNSSSLLKPSKLQQIIINNPPALTIKENKLCLKEGLKSTMSSSSHLKSHHNQSENLKQVFGDGGNNFQDFSTFCKRLDTISLKEPHLKNNIHAAALKKEIRGGGGGGGPPNAKKAKKSSCAAQARQELDISVDDLAGYLEDSIVFPKKMSYMAEMMYT